MTDTFIHRRREDGELGRWIRLLLDVAEAARNLYEVDAYDEDDLWYARGELSDALLSLERGVPTHRATPRIVGAPPIPTENPSGTARLARPKDASL